jgi:hypothetical protein
MLLSPVVRFSPLLTPNAMLELPAQRRSARAPAAVLLPPVVLNSSACQPVAALKLPVVLLPSAPEAVAVL